MTTQTNVSGLKEMTLNEIGRVIQRQWTKPYFAAKPYIEAMTQIHDGKYFLDDWTSIVVYFLSNAQTWRGDVAREVKKELKWRWEKKRMMR